LISIDKNSFDNLKLNTTYSEGEMVVKNAVHNIQLQAIFIATSNLYG
jgi:hypothetical protein